MHKKLLVYYTTPKIDIPQSTTGTFPAAIKKIIQSDNYTTFQKGKGKSHEFDILLTIP